MDLFPGYAIDTLSIEYVQHTGTIPPHAATTPRRTPVKKLTRVALTRDARAFTVGRAGLEPATNGL